jgi:hypothetical protein
MKAFKIPRISSAKTLLLVARNPTKFPSNAEELSVSFLLKICCKLINESYGTRDKTG